VDEGDEDKEESVTSDCVPKTMGRNHIEHWCVEGSRVRPRGLTWHDGRALHTVTQMSRVLPLPHKKKNCVVSFMGRNNRKATATWALAKTTEALSPRCD